MYFRKSFSMLAFALFLGLVCSSIAPALAFGVNTQNQNTSNMEALFLRDHGIMVGSGTDLMLDASFTVEQLMTVLAKLSGEEKIAKSFPRPPSFRDVPQDRWSAPYIAWAEDKGLTSGKGDGTVGYQDNVTAQRLSMFLLTLLGFDNVGWNESYDVAKAKGLFDGVTVVSKDELKRGMVTKIVYNALHIEGQNGKRLLDILGIEENIKPEEHQSPATSKSTMLESDDFTVGFGEMPILFGSVYTKKLPKGYSFRAYDKDAKGNYINIGEEMNLIKALEFEDYVSVSFKRQYVSALHTRIDPALPNNHIYVVIFDEKGKQVGDYLPVLITPEWMRDENIYF